ncbi:hypothetical protein ACNF40_03350 [Cuniculiplasma sp. SKW4]|uniref:hypothetical protein n=1 Tax=Cuniculiplasma sp. SKW4 TaxID=3400171 RepID=UPI003FD2ACC3
MGKLSAYILGLGFALIIGFYYLSNLYTPLLNWLMPVFGTPLIFIVTFLYLTLGDPFTNPTLLFILIMLGILIGISARKGSRAIGAGILVYGSIWGFIGSSIAAIIFFQTNSGNLSSLSTSSLPPVPKGSNLTQIMSEPLIGRIATAIENLISQSSNVKSATGIPTNINFQSIIYPFLPFLIINLVIILMTAAIVGMLVYRKIKIKNTPKGMDNSNLETNNAGKLTAIITILIALLLIASVLPITSSVSNGQTQNAGISMLNELPAIGMIQPNINNISEKNISSAFVAGSIISKSGDLFDLFGGYSTTNSTKAPWNYNNQNLITLEFVGDNLTTLFNSLGFSGLINNSIITKTSNSQYAGLIPEGMIISVYQGNLSSTSSFAYSQMNALSSLGVGSFVKILSISTSNLTIDNSALSGKALSFYVFGFNPDVYRVENSLYNQISNLTGNNNPLQILGQGLRDGFLVPGITNNSVNSSLYIGGYINYPNIFTQIGHALGLQSSTSKPVVFIGGVFEKNGVAYSSSTNHIFNLSSTMDYNNDIQIQSKAFNALFLGSPVVKNNSETYDFLMMENQNINKSSFNGNIKYINTGYATYITPNSVEMDSNYQFPAKILFTTKVISMGSGNFKIVNKLMNQDSDPISNITIDENNIYSAYSRDINLTSGKPYIYYSSSLNTNQCIYVNYSIHINSPGTYTFNAPEVTYTMNNTNYNYTAQSFSVNNNDKSFVSSVNTIWLSEFSMASKFTGSNILIEEIFPGFYMFDLIPLILILIDVFVEIRAFKRWRMNRS